MVSSAFSLLKIFNQLSNPTKMQDIESIPQKPRQHVFQSSEQQPQKAQSDQNQGSQSKGKSAPIFFNKFHQRFLWIMIIRILPLIAVEFASLSYTAIHDFQDSYPNLLIVCVVLAIGFFWILNFTKYGTSQPYDRIFGGLSTMTMAYFAAFTTRNPNASSQLITAFFLAIICFALAAIATKTSEFFKRSLDLEIFKTVVAVPAILLKYLFPQNLPIHFVFLMCLAVAISVSSVHFFRYVLGFRKQPISPAHCIKWSDFILIHYFGLKITIMGFLVYLGSYPGEL